MHISFFGSLRPCPDSSFMECLYLVMLFFERLNETAAKIFFGYLGNNC
jgi:hypothetical protein